MRDDIRGPVRPPKDLARAWTTRTNFEAVAWTPIELAEAPKSPKHLGQSCCICRRQPAKLTINGACGADTRRRSWSLPTKTRARNTTEIHRNCWRIPFEEGMRT